MAEPKPDVKELYLKAMQAHMLHDSEARSELTKAFKKQHAIVAKRVSRALGSTACRIAAKRLRNKALQMRKEQAGSLLQSTRAIKSIQIKGSEDFGLGCQTASSEPYFYDSAYLPVNRDSAIPDSEDGKCITARELEADSNAQEKTKTMGVYK